MGAGYMLLEGPRLAPAALNALERFTAAKDWSSGLRIAGLMAVLLAAAAAAVAGTIVTAVAVRRWRARHRWGTRLASKAQEYALSEREKFVLLEIAKLAKAREAESVFTVPAVFDRGQAALMASPRVASMSQERRRAIAELADAIRQKLGLPAVGTGGGDLRADGELASGDRLTVVHRGQPAGFAVRVAESSEGGLAVLGEAPVECRPGETWLVRYSKGGLLWEMDVSVTGQEGQRLRLTKVGHARFINRRRFPRIPTRREARIASFPTWRSDTGAPQDQFVAGRLTEIAGPGLRLEAPLETAVGQRVLVSVTFAPGSVLEAVGRVRHSDRRDNGLSDIAVELVGLSDEEIARLTQQTNAAAREARIASAPESSDEPLGEGAEGPAGADAEQEG